MATDFLSQASFTDGAVELPRDALAHGQVASNLLDWTRRLPAGSVIALQGGWGRGKTDVLARLVQRTMAEPPPPGVVAGAIWLNPWQYGSPDLLTPLVLALKARAQARGVSSELMAKAASTVVQAGISFGLKAASAAIPGAQMLGVVAPEAGRVAAGLVGERMQAGPGGDPVAELGGALRELASAVVPAEVAAVGGRLLVCVDDLDRCLPDRQVALLQALRFGLSAGAPITFVVGLDPVLARQGVLAHYRSAAFEPDAYLDKMFDLRLDLPAVGAAEIRALVAWHLTRPVVLETREQPLAELLPASITGVDAAQALPVPELRNPRLVARVFRKLSWLAGRLPPMEQGDHLLLYLALTERWPALRSALQDGPDFKDRLASVAARYVDHHGLRGDGSAAVQGLPTREQAPALSQIFRPLADRIARDELPWALCDGVLRSAGI
jgi:hypothetical protein